MKIESKRLILRNWEDGNVEDIVEGLGLRRIENGYFPMNM